MWLLKSSLLLICFLHHVSTISPTEELIYSWKALVKAGTHLPVLHASLFALDGKVHIQETNGVIHGKISNVTYKIYNGIIDHSSENKAQELPLPFDAHDLENVFKIEYNSIGLVVLVHTEHEEKLFSRNIKIAIADISQMHSDVTTKEYQRPTSFVKQESTIYGEVKVDYTVYPRENGEIEVHKLYDFSNSTILEFDSIISKECHCDLEAENQVLQNSKRVYRISKEGSKIVNKNVRTVGAVVYYPFQARSDAQNILVEQTFDLIEVVPNAEPFRLGSNLCSHYLNFTSFDLSENGGRRAYNHSKIFPQIVEMLKDVPAYLDENHINTQEPDTKRGQVINRILRLLTELNLQQLQELAKTLQEDTLNVYNQILPLVGTLDSAQHIKNLIINKQVSDDVAVEMLQKLPENLRRTPTALLADFEVLIHLNETFSWELRKVAILSFGTLIYQSYVFLKNDITKNPVLTEEYYQKYVDEYMSKLKNSKQYRVQMVYILGLRNMRLPITIKHLIPAFNGELWFDQHLRFLSMWAVTASLMDSDSDRVFETFWPIFSNPDELTEMRMVSFYYLMRSQPSHSRLKNIFTYLVIEKDDEVYNFCYTYLQAVLKSKNPCNKDLRLRVAQMLKFAPLPRGGVSSTSYSGYTDVNFGFGLEVENYLLNTNRSRIYGIFLLSHNYAKYEEENMFYVKLHDGKPTPAPKITSMLEYVLNAVSRGDLNNRFDGGGNHIEGAIVRRDKVINCYYYDQENLPELYRALDRFFIGDEKKINLRQIRYRSYEKAVIPTDIGFPAVWEYLQPQVDQHTFVMIRNDGSFEIEYRYVNWIHYRHGISFYNPLADVWQGVGRFHSYDESFPFNLEFLPNTVLSWKRSTDPVKNTGGIRSHVKQIVFVQDDETGVLKQSSPHSKHFQVVGDGKHSRDNYTLIDIDDFNTGHKIHMGIFDSNVRVSNGMFKHQMQLFAQTDTKQVHSPVDHAFLSYLNWRQFSLLLPRQGTYGFILQVAPSQKYDISKINLAVFWLLLPYHNLRLTYTIKNSKNQMLKTWIADAYIETSLGHNFENVTLNLTRLISGQKDYRVCVEGIKKMFENDARGHLKIAMGQTDDTKCPNDSTVEISLTGEHSIEQIEGNNKYASCQYVDLYTVNHYDTPECLTGANTLRRYEYSVKTKNLPNELKKSVVNWWNQLAGYYRSYYSYNEKQSEQLGNDNLKIEVEFPIQANEIDLRIQTPQRIHKLSGIPAEYWSWYGLSPDNSKSLRSFFFQPVEKWFNRCVIYANRYTFEKKSTNEDVPQNWTSYLQHPTYDGNVYVKLASNETLALKITHGDRTVEVHPSEGSFRIVVDGRNRSIHEDMSEYFFYYRSFVDLGLFGDFFVYDVYAVEYDIHRVVILTPNLENYGGRCEE